MLLGVKALSKHFGGVRAVEDVSFSLKEGMILSVIGPNGAGKTTLFNCLTGYLSPTKGSIHYSDMDISKFGPDRINRIGIARTFQNIRLFREMSVIENVMVARHSKIRSGLLSIISGSPSFRNEERSVRQAAFEYLEFLGLEASEDQYAGNLPYGDQRRLEIARALASEPKILLLDEPTAGMNPLETDEMMDTIRKIRSMGTTVILIEHDMKFVMNISDRIIVLDHGVMIAEGVPQEIKTNPLVIEAYLGKEIH